MGFAKGSSIEGIFDKLEKILEEKTQGAEKHVLKLYDNLPENPQSARGMLHAVKEDMKMDCGCCYRLAEPAMDILMTELLLLQHTINEIKIVTDKLDSEAAKKIKKTIDHNARIMHVMITGLKELGIHPSESLYNKTMQMYAMTYRIMNKGGGEKDSLFDHIVGMEASINSIIAVRDAKAKDNVVKGDFL